MSQELASLVVSLEANIAKFTSDMGRAALLAQRAFDDMAKSAKQLDDRITGLTKSAIGFAAAYVSVTQMTAAFRQSVDQMDQMAKMSQKFGVGTDELQRLSYAAKLSDVSTETLAASMKKLAVNISEATAASKSQKAMFDALGVAYKNADGTARGVEEVLGDVADKFDGAADGATKTAWAVALFGKSGQDMIPMLNDGKQGLKDLGDEAQKAGAVIGKDLLDASQAFNDNLDRIATILRGRFNQAVTSMTPQLNLLAESIIKVVLNMDKMFDARQQRDFGDSMARGLALSADAAIKAAQGFAMLAQSVITAAAGYRSFVALMVDLAKAPISIAKGESVIKDDTKRLADAASTALSELRNVNKQFFSNWGQVTKAYDAAINARNQTTNFGTGKAGGKDGKSAGQLPPPPAAAAGESAEEKEARRLFKAQVDGRVQTLEQGLAREKDVWSSTIAYIAQLRQMELIDERTADAARTAQREITLDRTLATYDAEIAELDKLKRAKGIAGSDIADIDNKIAAVESKRKQAVIDAAQQEAQAVLNRAAAQSQLEIGLREYYVALSRAQDAEQFQASLIGLNTSQAAGLAAEYKVLSEVMERLRVAMKNGAQIDPINELVDGKQRAREAGDRAMAAANDAAARGLAAQMAQYEIAANRQIELDNAQLDLTGKTVQEAEKLTNARRIQLDIEEQIRRAQLQSTEPIDRTPYDRMKDDLIGKSNATTDRRYAQLRDPWLGAQAAVVAYGEEATKVGQQIGNVFMTAFQGMEDAFVNFVKTGKLSFKDLADAIIVEIVRIAARRAAAGIGDWIFRVGSGMFGGGGGGGGSIVDAGISAITDMAAKGGVYSAGIKKFAAGGVVGTPTLFGMQGGLGLMGEAGPEAILPLKRGSGGKLGVVAQVGGGSGPVTINNTYQIDARSDRAQIIQMIEQGSRRTQATIQSQVSRGSTAYARPA